MFSAKRGRNPVYAAFIFSSALATLVGTVYLGGSPGTVFRSQHRTCSPRNPTSSHRNSLTFGTLCKNFVGGQRRASRRWARLQPIHGLRTSARKPLWISPHRTARCSKLTKRRCQRMSTSLLCLG